MMTGDDQSLGYSQQNWQMKEQNMRVKLKIHKNSTISQEKTY